MGLKLQAAILIVSRLPVWESALIVNALRFRTMPAITGKEK